MVSGSAAFSPEKSSDRYQPSNLCPSSVGSSGKSILSPAFAFIGETAEPFPVSNVSVYVLPVSHAAKTSIANASKTVSAATVNSRFFLKFFAIILSFFLLVFVNPIQRYSTFRTHKKG